MCLGTSHGSSRGPSRCSSSTTLPTLRVRAPRHVVLLVTRLVAPLVVDYSASRRLVIDYFASAARPGASARCAACHMARRAARLRLLRPAQAHRRLLRLRHASGCLGTSHGSSRGSSRCSSSSTPPRAGSSSTNSPPPRVRVPRHVTRLVTRLVAPLDIDYSASHRLVVDYFAYTARSGASARRAARHAARCATHRRLLHLVQARRRLLRLRRASGASASLAARRAARRLLLRPAQARRRLLHLRRASECLGTSRGLSRGSSRCTSSTTPPRAGSSSTTPPRAGSSSTTSPPPLVRVPRHVTRLVVPLVIDYSNSCRLVVNYFASAARPGASARRVARHVARRAAHRRLLRLA
jgi:hypothetical protein